MKLTDESIELLPLSDSDFTLFLKVRTCPQMMKHVYDPFTYEEAKSAFEQRIKPWTLESDKWRSFSINAVESQEKLGDISIRVIDHEAKIAEVGFMIKASAQGKGIGSKALKLIKQYAFDVLELNKLVAYCSVHNAGSIKLLEKHDFVRESFLKENTLIANQYVDDYAYGLCRSA